MTVQSKKEKQIIIGMDVGSTFTKAIIIDPSKKKISINEKTRMETCIPIASASGILGKILSENNININQVKKIMLTGTGSSQIRNKLFGIPTQKVKEITAIGIGGMHLSGSENILIANIGTGTSFVEASRKKIKHLGGTGVGGGTLVGLSEKILPVSGYDNIMKFAKKGDLSQIDLILSDVSKTKIGILNKKITVSNFGKVLNTANSNDIAIGIVNLVYQVIGMLAVFALKSTKMQKIVVTGFGSTNKTGRLILSEIGEFFGIKFEYPQDAEYATAIGAGLFSGTV